MVSASTLLSCSRILLVFKFFEHRLDSSSRDTWNSSDFNVSVTMDPILSYKLSLCLTRDVNAPENFLGTYFQSERLILNSRDSYLDIVSYNNEEVSISGGISAPTDLTWNKEGNILSTKVSISFPIIL